jgi:hypothetical protein
MFIKKITEAAIATNKLKPVDKFFCDFLNY